MADPQEDTVGEVVGDRRQETEATPISQNDVAKENGEPSASESLAEIGGKEKEDPTLNNSAPEGADIAAATEKGESTVTMTGEAQDTSKASPPLESSINDEVQEGGKAEEGATPEPLSKEEHDSTVDSIQETFPSHVGLDSKPSGETTRSPDVPQVGTEEGTKSEEAEVVPPLAEGIAPSDEPQAIEPTETKEVEQNPEKAETETEESTKSEEAEVVPPLAEGTGQSDEPVAAESTETEEVEQTPEKAQTETEVGTKSEAAVVGPPLAEGIASSDESHSAESTERKELEENPDKAQTETEEGTKSKEAEVEPPLAEGAALSEKPQGVDSTETEETPEKAQAETVEDTKSKEAEVERPLAEGIASSSEMGTESTETEEVEETPEKAQSEEIPESIGQTKAEGLEGIPETGDTVDAHEPAAVAEEETVDGPSTDVKRGIIEPVDTAKSGDALKTQVSETEAPKSTETNETQAQVVGQEKIPLVKSEEKSDEAQGVEGAERGIPTTLDINEAKEQSGPEVAEGAIYKADDTTERDTLEPQVVKGETPEPSESNLPKAAATEDEVVSKVVGNEDDSTADAGQAIPTAEDSAEPRQIEEGITQEVPASLPITAVEQEQPTVDADEPPKTRSFFGVVLKHVEPNGKLSTEDPPMGNHNSSDAEGSGNVDKSPEDAHGKPYVAPLPSTGADQDTVSGDAVPTDVDEGKKAAQAAAESDSTTTAAAPAILEEVSGDAELPKIVTAGTPEFDDSTKETGVAAPEVEAKETPPPEVSREFPGGAPEETGQDTLKGTGHTEEQGKVPNEEYKSEEAAETKRDENIPQEGAEPEVETSRPDTSEKNLARIQIPSSNANLLKQGEAAPPEDITTPRGSPLMQRVEHLEQKLDQLESRQSPTSGFASAGHSTPRSSVDKPFKLSTRFVLEETGSKGSLLDRVAALEQKLANVYLHHQSPSNSPSTPPISSVVEESGTAVDSKPAESQTPSGAEGDKAPEQVKSEEVAKTTEDPLKPSAEENGPKDPPPRAERMSASRSNSLNETKVKAKAAVGKITGVFTGCFSPKGRKTVS